MKCERGQVYLTGQVAPLCLKPYLQQSGRVLVLHVRQGKRDVRVSRVKRGGKTNCLCESQCVIYDRKEKRAFISP